MPRVIRDTLVSVRELLITGGPFIVLAVLALWLKMDAEETSVRRLDRNAEQ